MACATESLRGKTDLISHLPPVCMNRHPLCWKKRSALTAHSSAASTAALRADEGRTSKCPWILPWLRQLMHKKAQLYPRTKSGQEKRVALSEMHPPAGGSSYSTSSTTLSPTFFSRLMISSCRSLVRLMPFTDLM